MPPAQWLQGRIRIWSPLEQKQFSSILNSQLRWNARRMNQLFGCSLGSHLPYHWGWHCTHYSSWCVYLQHHVGLCGTSEDLWPSYLPFIVYLLYARPNVYVLYIRSPQPAGVDWYEPHSRRWPWMQCVWIIPKPSPPPSHPIHGKIVFHKTGPWCQNGWGPLLTLYHVI